MAEFPDMPEWAHLGSQHDLEWIQENAGLFHLAASVTASDAGRSAIAVHTTSQILSSSDHPLGYFSQEQFIEDLDNLARSARSGEVLGSQQRVSFLTALEFCALNRLDCPDVAAVIYLTDTSQLSRQGFGLLRATASLSIAVAVYILGHLSRRLPVARFLVGGVVAPGLAYTFIRLEPGLSQLLFEWG